MYYGEKLNSISHLVGAALALIGFGALLTISIQAGDLSMIISFSVFGLTLVLLYTMSTLYHSFSSSTSTGLPARPTRAHPPPDYLASSRHRLTAGHSYQEAHRMAPVIHLPFDGLVLRAFLFELASQRSARGYALAGHRWSFVYGRGRLLCTG